MWNRKNFIIFALFLNCIYFIGTSILVTRYVNVLEWSTRLEWLEHASEPILHKILFDVQTRESLEKELETFDFKKSIADWATKYQLIHLVELNTKNINWIGSRDKIPFNSKHLENRQELGFNKNSDKLLFSYILETKQKTFLISQQIEEQQIKQFLDAYDVDIMIAEKENLSSSRLLYTTLSLPVAQILLQKIQFNEKEFDAETFMAEKNQYLLKMVNLLDHSDLKQRMFFLKKIKNYEAVSINDVFVFIWTFFVISIVLNLILFKGSKSF